MERKETYTVIEVLSEVKPYNHLDRNRRVEFDGDLVKMESQRYRLFKRDGCTCVNCGTEGTYFAKERHMPNENFHFNLYGLDENDHEVMITKDHITPKSKGGKNTLSNYQVMCYPCNHEKSDK